MRGVELFSSEDFVKQILVMKTEQEVKDELSKKGLDLTQDEINELKKALRMVIEKNGNIVDDLMDQVSGPKWTDNKETNISIRAIIHRAGKIVSKFPYDFNRQFGHVWFMENKTRKR